MGLGDNCSAPVPRASFLDSVDVRIPDGIAASNLVTWIARGSKIWPLFCSLSGHSVVSDMVSELPSHFFTVLC